MGHFARMHVRDDDGNVHIYRISWWMSLHVSVCATNLAPSASSLGGPPARVTCAMAPAMFFTRELPPIFRTRAAAAFSCIACVRERINTYRNACDTCARVCEDVSTGAALSGEKGGGRRPQASRRQKEMDEEKTFLGMRMWRRDTAQPCASSSFWT